MTLASEVWGFGERFGRAQDLESQRLGSAAIANAPSRAAAGPSTLPPTPGWFRCSRCACGEPRQTERAGYHSRRSRLSESKVRPRSLRLDDSVASSSSRSQPWRTKPRPSSRTIYSIPPSNSRQSSSALRTRCVLGRASRFSGPVCASAQKVPSSTSMPRFSRFPIESADFSTF